MVILLLLAVTGLAQAPKLAIQTDGFKKSVSLSGEPNSTYHLFRTTDLSRWNPDEYVTVDTGVDGHGLFIYQDNSTHSFYKAVKSEVQTILTFEPTGHEVVLTDGEQGDVAHYALSSSLQVEAQSFKLDFSERIWLYVDTISIVDGLRVITTLTNLSQGDFVEVGTSQYQVRLPASTYVVQTGSTQHLTVRMMMKNGIHRPSTGLSIVKMQIRTVDANGFNRNSTSETRDTFTYFNKDNGQIVVLLDENSPDSKTVVISPLTQTDNIALARFNVVSKGMSGMLGQIVFGLRTQGASTSALFGNVKIAVGGKTYDTNVIGTNYAGFYNISVPLPADAKVAITVYGKVNQDVNGTLSGSKVIVSIATSTSLVLGSNPDVVDVNGLPLYVAPVTIQSNSTTFMSYVP